MLPSLYKLTQEHVQLMHTLDNLDLDAQTIQDTIDASGIMENVAEKGQGYVMVAKSFDQRKDAIDAEIERLTALKKHCDAVSKRLRETLIAAMHTMQIERIESPLMTISIRQNPESVDVFEPGMIPKEYMRQPDTPPPAPDKAKIKADMKLGKDVAGCRLVRSEKLHIA